MRWDDERYVRLYTRDTIAWKRLPWQSRALMPLLLRVVDRAGLVDLETFGAEGLADLVMMPAEVVAPGLAGLLADGTAELRGSVLCVRNFLEAQEIPMSDAQRQREKRARDRAAAREAIQSEPLKPNVTNVTDVRDGHETSRLCHSVPIRAVPSDPSVPSEKERSASPPARVRKQSAQVHPEAENLLRELNVARMTTIEGCRLLSPTPENLRHISDRLKAGSTAEDIRHVIAVCVAETRAGSPSIYFDAITPFRPDNFSKKVGAPISTKNGTTLKLGNTAPSANFAEAGDKTAEYT